MENKKARKGNNEGEINKAEKLKGDRGAVL
jgi:hypothetical protein